MSSTQPISTELLDIAAMCEVLGCSRSQLYALDKAGFLVGAVRLGRERRWRRREVLDWIASGLPFACDWKWRPTLPVKLDGLIRARTEQLAELRAEIQELEQRRAAGHVHTHVSRY